MQEVSYLEPPYQYLAWRAIQNIRESVDPAHPVQKATSVGVVLMTRYASIYAADLRRIAELHETIRSLHGLSRNVPAVAEEC